MAELYFRGAPNKTVLLRGEWVGLHQIWPIHFNTISQCTAELSMIQSIFTAWFEGEDNFVPPIYQR